MRHSYYLPALAMIILLAACQSNEAKKSAIIYPQAATVDSADEYFGTRVADPYRWLEGSAGLEPAREDAALDARVAAWTDAQNAYGRSVLDRLPGRKEIESRLRSLTGSNGAPPPWS